MRFLLFVFLFLISATQLFAKTVEVEMWTNFNGEKKNQRYEPLIVSIDEGDTVIWKSVEKSHNVEFMTGGVPEGGENLNLKLAKMLNIHLLFQEYTHIFVHPIRQVKC